MYCRFITIERRFYFILFCKTYFRFLCYISKLYDAVIKPRKEIKLDFVTSAFSTFFGVDFLKLILGLNIIKIVKPQVKFPTPWPITHNILKYVFVW